SFVPATPSFRWLLVAAAVWGSGSILISGLKGLGFPGLSTVARFAAALVTIVALVALLPRLSIVGAAVASLIGYAVMAVVALVALMRTRQWNLVGCFKPQRHDLPIARLKSLLELWPIKPKVSQPSAAVSAPEKLAEAS